MDGCFFFLETDFTRIFKGEKNDHVNQRSSPQGPHLQRRLLRPFPASSRAGNDRRGHRRAESRQISQFISLYLVVFFLLVTTIREGHES